MFQSAPSYGERRPRISVRVTPGVFQSAPSYGERQAARGGLGRDGGFQSAPSYGERRRNPAQALNVQSFNPRPPTESDIPHDGAAGDHVVSIRALLRRATRTHQAEGDRTVFQSAPSYGERLRVISGFAGLTRFNPRPPTESDLPDDPIGGSDPVSIRALLRRATYVKSPSVAGCAFQSAPSYGERPGSSARGGQSSRFNPRPPTESDRVRPLGADSPVGFNPRPPTESDPPVRRRRRRSRRFNPRPPTESDRVRPLGADSPVGFNPRPPAESDPAGCCLVAPDELKFQSAPPCGERPSP